MTMTLQSNVAVVVGIRIGTNYTSLINVFSDRKTRYLSPMWKDPFTHLMSSKQPTVAVYSPDKVFQAFGFEAVEHIQEQNNTNLLVLSNFVKGIFCSGIHIPKYVLAENGVMVSSFDLMSSVIPCLFRTITLPEMGSQHMRYVFTMPSTACDNHEKFLESAAKNAGLHEGQILVIPEAASILHFCNHNHRVHRDGKEMNPFIVGKQNVVLECEDDNVSISILRLQNDDSMEILYNSFENEMPLSQVQYDFNDLMSQIFGKSVFDDFFRDNISDYYYLLHTLHDKAKGTPTEKITFTLPAGLLALFEEKTGKQIEKAIEKTKLANKVLFKAGKCRIALDVFQALFMDAGTNMVQLLHKLFVRIELKEKVNIILAGQFSNSVIFQDTIRREFPDHYVIAEGDEMVIKGAALYGHRPVKVILKAQDTNTLNGYSCPSEISSEISRTAAQVAISVQREKKRRTAQSCSIL